MHSNLSLTTLRTRENEGSVRNPGQIFGWVHKRSLGGGRVDLAEKRKGVVEKESGIPF